MMFWRKAGPRLGGGPGTGPGRRVYLALVLLGALAWWAVPDEPSPVPAEPAPPAVVRKAAHTQRRLRQLRPGEEGAWPAPPASAVAAQWRAAAQAWQPAAAASAAGAVAAKPPLVLTSARKFCASLPRGDERRPTDEAQLQQDEEAARTQFLQFLLSSPDPQLHALGLLGSRMLDMLVIQAAASTDPHISALALMACVRESRRFAPRYGDGGWRNNQFVPCVEFAARRWTQLASDNAVAWLTLAMVADKQDDEALLETALTAMAQAKTWEAYPGFFVTRLMEAMPEDFSWWQRGAVAYLAPEIGDFLRTEMLIPYGYCAPDLLEQFPDRYSTCRHLAEILRNQAQDSYSLHAGVRTDFNLEEETRSTYRLKEILYEAEREQDHFWRKLSDTDEAWDTCQVSMHWVHRRLRSQRDGGELLMLKEEAARAKRRPLEPEPEPEPQPEEWTETPDAQ